MKKFLLMCFSFGFALSVWAQDRVVTGKVTSKEDGSSLPGVNVSIKGTTLGTSTDADGKYSLSVPTDAGSLVFSFIGLKSEEVEIGGRTAVDIQLGLDATQLSEVVVIGYGTAEKKDLTGALASVKGTDISNLATPSFDQQLAGRAAGVNVSIPSGIIGQAPVIRIRGVNSMNSGADPLIVVDNMPINIGNSSAVISNNALADINPNDIESMEILKDGSATAIYGSRAANGVILITTKKGHKGAKAQVNYDAYTGFADTFRKYKVLDADQFVQIQNEKFTNAYGPGNDYAQPMTINGKPVNTNWQDLIFRKGFIQNHALSLTGATDKTSYFFSLGWTDQKGVAVNNEMNRYTFRGNFDHKVTKWLSFGSDMGLTRTKTIGLNTSSGGLSGNVFNALNEFPNVPVYNADGTYNISGAYTGQGANAYGNDWNLPNLAYVLNHNKHSTTVYRLIGNAHVEATIHKDFKVRSQVGIDGLLTDDFMYWDAKQGDGYPAGLVYQQYSPTIRWDWYNTLGYSKMLGDAHKINATVGFEYQKQTQSNYSAQGQNLSSGFFGQNNIINGTTSVQQIGGDYVQNGIASLFARASYSYKDKYLLQGSVRRDDLSALSSSNRSGVFPGGSIGWRISNEDFYKSSNVVRVLSDLKVRASYATVGNTQIGNFPYAATYSPIQYGTQRGVSYATAGNPNLKWETSKKLDIGLDLAFLDNKITVTADYFQNNVDGMIMQFPTAPSLGIPLNYINKNAGAMQNQGLEFAVNALAVQKGAFSWNVSANYTSVHNKITNLANSGDILTTYQISRVGQSLGSFYGYEYAGVNKANGNPMYYKADGSIVQQDISNTNLFYGYNAADAGTLGAQSSLGQTDKRVLGRSTPTWFGGFNNTFTYKSFDLNIFCRFSGGNKIMNVTRQGLLTMQFANNGTEILNRWQSPENPGNGSVPKLVYGNDQAVNMLNNTSTRFLEKGDFFRIQNIVFGYSLPKETLDRIKMTKIRVYAQVQNAFLFTGYKGIDPEANANPGSNTTSGIDNNVNPQQRTFTLGVNIGL